MTVERCSNPKWSILSSTHFFYHHLSDSFQGTIWKWFTRPKQELAILPGNWTQLRTTLLKRRRRGWWTKEQVNVYSSAENERFIERIENYLEKEVARMKKEGIRPIEIENEKLKILNDFKGNDFYYMPNSQMSK